LGQERLVVMNPSKYGLSTGAKTGIVVIVVIIVLAAAYVVPSLTKASSTTTQPGGAGSGPITGALSLYSYFPKMSLAEEVNDVPDAVTQNGTYTYSVLGKGTLNSSQYTRVEFTTVGASNDVIAWYNSTGGINLVDVVGVRNYTGAGAYILAQGYTTSFGLIPAISNNATLLDLLSKTTTVTQSIGPTKMNVTTYSLEVPTSIYSTLTVKYGTIPGTNVQIAVYLSEKETDGTTILIDVTSLTQ
jgi:hypothetical protein